MFALVGLLFNFSGAVLMALPEIPQIYYRIHKIPPLIWIQQGEKKLYQKGEVYDGDPGFDYMTKALMSGPQPYNEGRYGFFREFSAEFPSDDGKAVADYSEFRPCRIKRKQEGEEDITDSDFAILLAPKEPDEWRGYPAHISEDEVLHLETIIPNGRFPALINQYKRRTITKMGIALLSFGFLVQIFGYISQL